MSEGRDYATACPVEVEPIDGLDAYTVRITGQLLDAIGEESVYHLSRVIAIAVFAKKAERAGAVSERPQQ